jgi:hypothetical protein
MPYFISWDVNVFLCLVTVGLPGDVVKGIVKMAKKNHEKLSLEDARNFHCMNIKPIHDYISLKTAWEKRRDIDLFSVESDDLRLNRKDLLLIREPGSGKMRESIKQHNHYLKVMKEYDKVWGKAFPSDNPRVILLDRMLTRMSQWDRVLLLEDLIEKLPINSIKSHH